MWVKHIAPINSTPAGIPVEVSDAFGARLITVGAEEVAPPGGPQKKASTPDVQKSPSKAEQPNQKEPETLPPKGAGQQGPASGKPDKRR